MRLTGLTAFALLSVLILSCGIGGVAFAADDFNPALPISTNLDRVYDGADLIVSGTIKDYDSSSGKGLTFVVVQPNNGGRAGIGQPSIDSDGSFSASIIVGGPNWKFNGDYTINFHYGADTSKVVVTYADGEDLAGTPPTVEPPVAPTVEPPAPPTVEPPPAPATVEPPPPATVEPPPAPATVEPPAPKCGAGTQLVDGVCQAISTPPPKNGCLIATAAYGTELAPQVQFLREIRDNTVLSTSSGAAFMSGFNTVYYSFAPTVADWERENPMFKEAVRAFITPMISTLSIMTLADNGSEAEVLGLGISVIALNLGMYIAAPALIGFKINKIVKSRK